MASHSTPMPSTTKDPTTTTTPPPPTAVSTKPSPLPRAAPPPQTTAATTVPVPPFSLPRDPTTATTTVPIKPSPLQRAPSPALRPNHQPRTPQFLHHPQQLQQQQQQQIHHIQPGFFPAQTPDPNWSTTVPIRYPLASSGRGLIPTAKPVTHQLPEQLTPSSIVGVATQQFQQQQQQSNHVVRGTFLHPSSNNNAHASPVSAPGVAASVRGVHPQSKVGSSLYSAPESNASKDPTDKGIDDTFVTLRDRKVRLSEGASLYALCRSWLRNGTQEANQPQYADAFKSRLKPLPLPLPLPPHASSPSKRKELDDETEVDEVENLAEIDAKELLSRHVRRAKKIRARLREERLQRIERYKSRLVLLLPHSVPE